MLRFILTRLSLLIPTFLGMTLVAFLLIRLVPGDPIETMAGERGIDAARHAALLKEYGLDRPVMVQYGIYIGRVLHGDLGKSIITHEPVLREFAALFPATLELGFCAIVFALLLGIPAGIIAGSVALPVDKRAWRRNACQFLKRDGFFLPMHKTGRQKTSRYRLPAGAGLYGSCA